jgi:hypothetical protein
MKIKSVLKWGIGSAVGLFAFLVAVGLLVDSPEASSSTTVTEEQPAQDSAIGIGDKVVSGDRAMTVTSVEIIDGIASSNQFVEPSEGRFAVVYFDGENIGNKSGGTAFSSYTLEDGQGREYSEVDGLTEPAVFYWREDESLDDRFSEFYPGQKYKDAAVFSVAPDASEFVIKWKGKTISLD